MALFDAEKYASGSADVNGKANKDFSRCTVSEEVCKSVFQKEIMNELLADSKNLTFHINLVNEFPIYFSENLCIICNFLYIAIQKIPNDFICFFASLITSHIPLAITDLLVGTCCCHLLESVAKESYFHTRPAL